MADLYAYVPGDYSPIALVNSVTGETHMTVHRSREAILAAHPKALFLTEEECNAAMAASDDKKYLEETKEITEERYWYWLEVLPPIDFNGRMFRMGSEVANGIYLYCTTVEDKFFQSTRRSGLTARQDFLKECRELIAS